MSLRIRINILISIVMILFLIGLSEVLLQSSKKTIEEGVESSHKVTLQLLDTFILSSAQNPDWGYTHEIIQPFLQELGYVRSNDIFLYDLQNNLLYRTPESTYKLDVKPPQWFINYMLPKMETNSKVIRYGRLIVQANPSGAIREAWVFASRVFIASFAFLIFINILVYWLIGRWFREIPSMLSAIEQLGRGNFNVVFPQSKITDFEVINKNFNRMKVSLAKFVNENKKLALVSQQTADAIMILDSEAKIIFWNNSAKKMFGYTNKEILGKSAKVLVPKKHIQELESNLDFTHRKNKKIFNIDTQRVTKNKKLINVSISISPLYDPEQKKVIGDIVSMRDITEKIKAIQSELALKKNKQLTAIIQEHIEDERRSLARELHDELGQYVSAIKIFSQNIINKAKDKNILDSSNSVMSAANQIYDGMHNIIKNLRPASLDNLGLVASVNDLVLDWKKKYPNITINFVNNNFSRLSKEIEISVYRVIQESMNNSLKHSHANQVNIKLKKINKNLEVSFHDNGVGFDISILKNTKQFGIIGMKERVQALKGKFEISSDSNGTLISCSIPI